MQCGSGERHRLVWLYFKRKTNLFYNRVLHVLHVAPELVFVNKFKAQFEKGYVTADLFDTNAMVKMDITNIQMVDETFDVIYCSHVLEHVPDDKKAMREFLRVLKPNGWAVLLVPVDAEKTIEDISITNLQERLEKFGDVDHVCCYGPDFKGGLEEAGFKVTLNTPADFLTPQEIVYMGITSAAGDVYFCTK